MVEAVIDSVFMQTVADVLGAWDRRKPMKKQDKKNQEQEAPAFPGRRRCV